MLQQLHLISVCPGFVVLRHSKLLEKTKMETRTSKRLCVVNEMKSNKKKVQWKYLPEDIWNLIFLNYCDFTSLVNSRFLQTEYVKECTEGNDMGYEIHARNLKNMKWIYESNKGFRWWGSHFMFAAEYGELEMMKWMKTKGCPWDFVTFAFAVRIYNCPWNDYTFYKNMIKQPAVHEWLLNHAMTLN